MGVHGVPRVHYNGVGVDGCVPIDDVHPCDVGGTVMCDQRGNGV